MDDLKTIAGRLADGAAGPTEADVQSDVRNFLLDAPLDLDGPDLEDVLLERVRGSELGPVRAGEREDCREVLLDGLEQLG